VRERVRTLYERSRHWLPAAFFIGGFAWDAITLGRAIKPIDLVIILGYFVGAAAILLVLGRGVTFRGSEYLNAVLQFFFGGIFSALFIFYFLSASGLPELTVVLLLAATLIGNEFLESAYSELTLSWAFFTLSGVMFFNFALAHLFRSISVFWFYLGTLIALLATIALRRLSTRPASIAPSIAVAVILTTLHAFNFIPPVPLVKKEMIVAHDVRRSGSSFAVEREPAGWRVWRSSSPDFHLAPGGRVYCFTSVFVPPGIETTIRHRWERHDDRRGEWTNAGVVPFRISGGREAGYRGYTFKRSVQPGRWRVIAESESGAAIGVLHFEVVAADTKPRTKVVKL
jgi:hypothetical protein